MSVSWFVSTVLLTSLGFYMWPHAFASSYTAKSEDVFRKNAAVMPLYQLVLLFVFFTGFAPSLQVPGLVGAQADLSLLKVSKLAFPPLVVGLIGAAGLLTALVPGSMILMTACTILAKNVYQPLARAASEQAIARLARAAGPGGGAGRRVFTLHGGDAIVPLLLLGYNFVTQLFPSLLMSLPERPLATPAGVMAGIATGVATIAWTSLTGTTLAKLLPDWPSAVTDVNVGIVAMIANIAVLLVVSALTRKRSRGGGHGDRAVARWWPAPASRAEESRSRSPASSSRTGCRASIRRRACLRPRPQWNASRRYSPGFPFRTRKLGWGLGRMAGAIHGSMPTPAQALDWT
jgi:SSS family solute:Na+ symporter